MENIILELTPVEAEELFRFGILETDKYLIKYDCFFEEYTVAKIIDAKVYYQGKEIREE